MGDSSTKGGDLMGDLMQMHADAVEKVENIPADIVPDCTKIDRKRQAIWDSRHLRTVSTKLRKEDYAALLDVCMLRGTSPYALLRRMIRSDLLGLPSPAAPPFDEGPHAQ